MNEEEIISYKGNIYPVPIQDDPRIINKILSVITSCVTIDQSLLADKWLNNLACKDIISGHSFLF